MGGARRELDRLEAMPESAKWGMEIRRERRLLHNARQEESGQARGPQAETAVPTAEEQLMPTA